MRHFLLFLQIKIHKTVTKNRGNCEAPTRGRGSSRWGRKAGKEAAEGSGRVIQGPPNRPGSRIRFIVALRCHHMVAASAAAVAGLSKLMG